MGCAARKKLTSERQNALLQINISLGSAVGKTYNKAVTSNLSVMAGFLGFSKAFDKLNHKIFIQNLEHIRIRGIFNFMVQLLLT